jgi:hypothetical protein
MLDENRKKRITIQHFSQGKIFKLSRYMLLRMANAIFKIILRFDTVVKHNTISFLKVLFAVVLQPEGKQIPELLQTHFFSCSSLQNVALPTTICRPHHRVHIWGRVEIGGGGQSALSAGAYTTTLYVMVDIMKGGAYAGTPTLIRLTPESGHCHSVYSVFHTHTSGISHHEKTTLVGIPPVIKIPHQQIPRYTTARPNI